MGLSMGEIKMDAHDVLFSHCCLQAPVEAFTLNQPLLYLIISAWHAHTAG